MTSPFCTFILHILGRQNLDPLSQSSRPLQDLAASPHHLSLSKVGTNCRSKLLRTSSKIWPL